MPQFSAEHPTITRKIQDIEVTLPQLFVEGHPLTANEAKFVNERLNSIMVNAYGGDIRRALEKIDAERAEAHKEKKYQGPWAMDEKDPTKEAHPRKPAKATVSDLPADEWDHQARVNEKFTNYRLGAANFREGNANASLDTLAKDIAERELRARLAKKGIKVKPLQGIKNEEGVTKFQELIAQHLEKNKERIVALAQAQLDSISEGADDEDDDLDIPEGLVKAA